jgi:hypothetical protein
VAQSGGGLRTQRIGEPAPQQAAAGTGAAAVEKGIKRRRRLAAQRLGDLQIPPRREVER